ncbi:MULTISPECIES: ABC transporter permease [unclassified Bacillus (in: firmicutes)]|uniref:ABC transporter permease n=1 Tax=unclassified Bacillus (in: firmicutes) TaxID=185979 RepID=UPI000D02FF40|nr:MULTISPECIES: ABC transporter permease [unclassified Bacillus (in: firmicutes)]PRS80490.1 ABC transporter permease [Bacillus sp. CJCL2]PRS86574.1 ABC transporter permease [Bacillus sp. YBWC18]
MHKISAIITLKLKETLKSPLTLIFLFVMPIVFSFIFGSTASDTKKPTVAFIQEPSEGKLNQEIFHILEKNTKFLWIKTTESEAKDLVYDEKAVASVKVANQLKSYLKENKEIFDVTIYKKTEEYAVLSPFLKETAAIIYQLNQGVKEQKSVSLISALNKLNESGSISLIEKKQDGQTREQPNLTPLGFTIMFMMFAISSSVSSIHLEYKDYTWQRLLSSPIHKISVLLGYFIAYFLLGWIQLGVLLTVLSIFFNVYLGNFMILVFGSFVIGLVVSLSFMIATLSHTKKQAEVFSAIIIVGSCMLGGIYWPLDIVPDIMKKISLAIPQTWMMSGFGEIMSGTVNHSILLLDITVLAAFTIVFMVIGLKNIRSY